MIRASALLVLLLASLASAPALAEDPARLPSPEPGSYALPPLGVAGDGAVLESDGTSTTLHALFGDHIVLLAFIYSSCGEAEGCPMATAVFHRVGRLLKDDSGTRSRLRLLSLSFDPERDTPDAMARVAGSVAREDLDWRFLTTRSDAQLLPILSAYGQTRVEERGEEGAATGRLAHVLRVFLIDESGRIRNIYGASYLEAELVVADVRTLLLEEGAR